MHASLSKLVPGVLLVASLLAGNASAETLKLAGTGGAMPMAERVGDAFFAATGVKIEVIQGLGSGGAIDAVGDGVIDLAISARRLKPEEISRGLTAVPLARTAFVLVTSHPNPDGVSHADLVAIFSSTDPKWSDGTPISILLRPKSDGDALLFEELVPGMASAMETARARPEIPVTPTDQDNATFAEDIAGSLVQAGLSQIVMEKRNLRLVPIDGVAPTLENLESGKYPYEKPFYLVYSAKSQAGAERLLEFLRSPEGEAALLETGNLPFAE